MVTPSRDDASFSADSRATPISAGDTSFRWLLASIALLTVLRFALGAVLPLSFDEAYYWLWSKHLAAGYFDHPPAVAFVIRAGTILFGDTSFGVRAVPLLGSILASWAVWRAGLTLLGNRRDALLACLYFNLTLMVAAETMAATPDAPALAASALLLCALAELTISENALWWLAVGIAGGLCLLSKYTGFFLGAGTLLWLFATPRGRRWTLTPFPWLAIVAAVAMFAPVILWNASEGWISFKFQFGRVAAGGWTARYLGEFLLAQIALASPFILILGVAGFAKSSRSLSHPIALASLLIWPAVLYFLAHSLHDRVQGNWPSFAYPAFSVLAAFGGRVAWRNATATRAMTVMRALAVPVAVLVLVVVYAQAFFEIIPFKGRDPIARLTAIGFQPVADGVAALAKTQGASAIVTASYATTGWLAFSLDRRIPVLQVDEEYRWLAAPPADPRLAHAPLLLVVKHAQAGSTEAEGRFAQSRFLMQLARRENGNVVDRYDVFRVSGWRGPFDWRQP